MLLTLLQKLSRLFISQTISKFFKFSVGFTGGVTDSSPSEPSTNLHAQSTSLSLLPNHITTIPIPTTHAGSARAPSPSPPSRACAAFALVSNASHRYLTLHLAHAHLPPLPKSLSASFVKKKDLGHKRWRPPGSPSLRLPYLEYIRACAAENENEKGGWKSWYRCMMC